MSRAKRISMRIRNGERKSYDFHQGYIDGIVADARAFRGSNP
jgi:hypothetical protein